MKTDLLSASFRVGRLLVTFLAGVFFLSRGAEADCEGELQRISEGMVRQWVEELKDPNLREAAVEKLTRLNTENYQRMATSYAQGRSMVPSPEMRRTMDGFLKRVRELGSAMGSQARVLDLGAGPGRAFFYMRQNQAVDLHAMEVSAPFIRMLQQTKLSQQRITQASMDRLPYREEVFSGVFAHAVLFHLPRVPSREHGHAPPISLGMDRALQEIHRVLRPRGWGVATFKKGKGFRLEQDARTGSRFFQLLTLTEVQALVEGNGFNMIEVREYQDRVDWISVLMQKADKPKRSRN